MKITPMQAVAINQKSNNKTKQPTFGTTLMEGVKVGPKLEEDIVNCVLNWSKNSVPIDKKGPYSFMLKKTGFIIDLITKDNKVPNIIFVSSPAKDARAFYEIYPGGMSESAKKIFKKTVKNLLELVKEK